MPILARIVFALLLFILIFLFSSISFAEKTDGQKWAQASVWTKQTFVNGYVWGRVGGDSRWYSIICREKNEEKDDLCSRIKNDFFPDTLRVMTIGEIQSSVYDYVNTVFSREKYKKLDVYEVLNIAYIATVYSTLESEFWEQIEMLKIKLDAQNNIVTNKNSK